MPVLTHGMIQTGDVDIVLDAALTDAEFAALRDLAPGVGLKDLVVDSDDPRIVHARLNVPLTIVYGESCDTASAPPNGDE